MHTDLFAMLDNFDRLSALISRNSEGLDFSATANDRQMDAYSANNTLTHNEWTGTLSDSQQECG